jgi:hypothetical protein
VKYFLYSGLALLVVGLSLAVAFSSFVPPYLQKRIVEGATEDCDTCSLEIEDITISPFSPERLVLNNVRFRGGNPQASSYDVHIDTVDLEVKLRPLWERRLHVTSLSLTRPKVTLIEGEKRSKKREEDETAPKYRLENVRLTNGLFTYVRNYKGTHAVLNMTNVELETGVFGTEDELIGKPLVVNASLVLEQAGKIELDIYTYMFAEGPLTLDTNIRIKNQDLGRLTSFFRPNAGVILEGRMLEGVGSAKMRGETLEASVTSTFKDLKIKLEKEAERSSFEALLGNIGLAIDANKENVSKPAEDRTRKVTITREPEERVVGFVLRGLKEAAIRVVRAD